MKFFTARVCVAMVLCGTVLARPVSYPGGVTLMQMNDVERNSIHLHYSPTARYSIGYKGEYWRDDEWQFHGVQLNKLLKRWNKPASQANLYVKSGVGIVRADDSSHHPAAFVGFAADWEDRRYFAAYENRFYDADKVAQFFSQTARIGIAPYIGDYGDLHTWFILQADHRPKNSKPIRLTAVLRLFKSVYMAELGLSEEGDALINVIIRY